MPNASRDASRWIRKRLYLAAIAERGDGQFLDQIGDGHRFADPVRAAIAGAAERAAAPAGIPGNKTARRDQQQLDGMLACRGQAGAQAGRGPPVRRLPQELGCWRWSCRFRQSRMTRSARARTFAGVSVCGSAMKQPAN